MSDQTKPERPRQVTLAGWLIVVGSVLVVLAAFERMSSLHSLETQEAISEFLSRPPGDALGLSRDGAQSLLRVLAMVAGATAAAAAILGYQVLARSRSARVVLSLLTVPLFIAGMAVFGFLSALVVVSIVMLWLQPAKDWFNGITTARPAQPAASAVVAPPPIPPPRSPAALVPSQPQLQQPAVARPTSVTAACIVTWSTCGLGLLLMSLVAMVLLAAPEAFFDEVRRQDPDFGKDGLTESQVREAALIGSVVAGVWCLASIGFAVATVAGYRWGWLALVISTVAAGALAALLMLGNLVLVVPMVAAAVTVGLLLRPGIQGLVSQNP